MKSEVIKNQETINIFKLSLTFALIAFALTMSPTSYFGLVKSATAAGTLTNISLVPSSNLATMMSTYDISFRTGTTGTIKTIEILFPNGQFDVDSATRYLERSGIGSGSISVTNNPGTDSNITYTVNNPERVQADTFIKMVIPRIIANVAGNFQATITTKNTGGGIIDGPTLSSKFLISDVGTTGIADNSITGQDLSTSLTIRKTLHDDAVGHAHGWNPDTSTRAFGITDSDISGGSSSEFVSVMVRSGNPAFCAAASGDAGLIGVYCDSPPGNSAELDYIITKLPAHNDVASSLSASSSESTPSSTSPSLTSSPHKSALADIESYNRQDDIATEFP